MDAKDFDLLLSFAGEEREYARAIHEICKANGLSVFLDEEFQHEIWGENLVEYLSYTYRERGRYVVLLVSEAYCRRAYTRVEWRASFDRMIGESSPYVLPVKVDDGWIEGLPRATAYLDLRVQGVLGICEALVEKLSGPVGRLEVPPSVSVPRVPNGSIPAHQLATYLLDLSRRPQTIMFGCLVYDEGTVALRKLLRDRDYWDALDKASGPHFEVFAIRDTVEYEHNYTVELMTAASLARSQRRGYYFSKLLRDYFGQAKTQLSYPSLLLFIVRNGRIHYCRLIPFRASSLEEAYSMLSALLTMVSNAVDEVGGPGTHPDKLWVQIRNRLLDSQYTVYIQEAPADADSAIESLKSFIEEAGSS